MSNENPVKEVKYSDLIDSNLDDFSSHLMQFNYGSLQGLYNLMNVTYNDLSQRKDGLIRLSSQPGSDKEEIANAVNGVYSILLKIEEKMTIIKNRMEELKGQFDTNLN